MVHAHVERDGSGLHVSYYDVDHHKEGAMELHFLNPADSQKVHDNDKVEILDLTDAKPDAPVTVHVEHPDGTSEDIRCSHS